MRHRSRDTRELNTEHEIGRDVQRILDGRGVARRELDSEAGPDIFPGMEDAGIGAVPYAYGEDVYTEEMYAGDPGRERRPVPDGGKPRAGKRGRGPYLFISYAFMLLFLLLLGQIVYFNLKLKDGILNSPYNRRQNALAEYITRGEIRSHDGAVLAKTVTDEEGNETRVYPYANEYAHAVGFATYGKSGVEAAANYQLMTSHANIIDGVINDLRGRKNPGDNVITTLDSRLQDISYSALGDFRGAVIVMNPKTGAIYAMVAKPNFDPNTLAETWDEMVSDASNSQLLNRATQGLYPPGSTFKMVTSLAYFRRYHDFSRFHYECTGEYEVGSIKVHCFKGTVHGEEDYTAAFARSCNTAFSQIGLDLGASALTRTADSLLFGESLPSDIPASKSRWSLTNDSGDAEVVQTAFGQGKTLVTPYHMALIVSAVANDGVLMKPRLIDHVENASGMTLTKTRPARYRQLLTASEASALRNLMTAVVTDGSASALYGRGYEVAGKTGSAEYVTSEGNIGTHSWFVGFTGGDDPDLAIAVLAEDGGAGSSTAVPIAGEILDTYYAGIDEEYRQAEEEESEVPLPESGESWEE